MTELRLDASERTYLAWWRSGLAAFAVAVAAGKIVPALASVTTWPYTILGVGFSLMGIGCCAHGYRMQQAPGEHSDDSVLTALTGAAAAMGLLLVVAFIIDA